MICTHTIKFYNVSMGSIHSIPRFVFVNEMATNFKLSSREIQIFEFAKTNLERKHIENSFHEK